MQRTSIARDAVRRSGDFVVSGGGVVPPPGSTVAGVFVFDSIHTVGLRLDAFVSTGQPKGTLAYVGNDTFAGQGSVHRYYTLVYGENLVADGIEVVNSSTFGVDGAQWLSQDTPNQQNYQKLFWAVDSQNVSGVASDENDGWGVTAAAAQLRPLLSVGEFTRRIAMNPGREFTAIVQVLIMSDVTDDQAQLLYGFATSQSTGVGLCIVGVPTVTAGGVLTAVTNLAGNVRGTVTTSAPLPGVSGPAGGRMIRKVGGGWSAWIDKNIGGNQYAIGIPLDTSFTVSTGVTAVQTNPVNGDAYETVTFPRYTGCRSVPPGRVRMYFLDFTSVGSVLPKETEFTQFVTCFFRQFTGIDALRATSLTNCGFASGAGNGIGDLQLNGCFLQGTGLTSYQFNRVSTQMGGLPGNLCSGAVLRVSHQTHIELGQLWLFDCTSLVGALTIDTLSSVDTQGLQGSGNLGPIANVAQPNCKLTDRLGAFAGWTATTAAAKPLVIGALTYNYADLPVFSGSSFVSNS